MKADLDRQLWRQCAVVALGVLRWPPEVFWAATPADLYLALQGVTGRGLKAADSSPLSRAELEDLCALFPDRPVRNR